jgi:hypothetical protein
MLEETLEHGSLSMVQQYLNDAVTYRFKSLFSILELGEYLTNNPILSTRTLHDG